MSTANSSQFGALDTSIMSFVRLRSMSETKLLDAEAGESDEDSMLKRPTAVKMPAAPPASSSDANEVCLGLCSSLALVQPGQNRNRNKNNHSIGFQHLSEERPKGRPRTQDCSIEQLHHLNGQLLASFKCKFVDGGMFQASAKAYADSKRS